MNYYHGFGWHFACQQMSGHGRTDQLLSTIRIIVRMPEPDCFLWYRMHCNAEFYYVRKIPQASLLGRWNTVVGGKCALPSALLVTFASELFTSCWMSYRQAHWACVCLESRLMAHWACVCLESRLMAHWACVCLESRLMAHWACVCLESRLMAHWACLFRTIFWDVATFSVCTWEQFSVNYNMKIVHIGTTTKKEKKRKKNLTREKT